jgi:hypothetical protein
VGQTNITVQIIKRLRIILRDRNAAGYLFRITRPILSRTGLVPNTPHVAESKQGRYGLQRVCENSISKLGPAGTAELQSFQISGSTVFLRCNWLIALRRAWANNIGLLRLIVCCRNGHKVSHCVEERRARVQPCHMFARTDDGFSPLRHIVPTSAATADRGRHDFASYASKSVPQRLKPSLEGFFTARLNPCPSCRDAFSLSLFSVYAPADREI